MNKQTKIKHYQHILKYVKEDKLEKVAHLLQYGTYVDSQFEHNNLYKDIMVVAVNHQNNPMVELLLKAGFNPNINNSYPVKKCIMEGNFSCFKLLHQYGANIHFEKNWPLQLAIKYHHLPFVIYINEQLKFFHENFINHEAQATFYFEMTRESIYSKDFHIFDYLYQQLTQYEYAHFKETLFKISAKADMPQFVQYLIDDDYDISNDKIFKSPQNFDLSQEMITLFDKNKLYLNLNKDLSSTSHHQNNKNISDSINSVAYKKIKM